MQTVPGWPAAAGERVRLRRAQNPSAQRRVQIPERYPLSEGHINWVTPPNSTPFELFHIA